MTQILGSIGKNGKLIDTTQGILGDASLTMGAKVGWNVADKTLGKGKLTSIGVTVTQNFLGTGKPLCFNLTDLGAVSSVFGLKKAISGKSITAIAVSLMLAKVAEAKGWIDPPTGANSFYPTVNQNVGALPAPITVEPTAMFNPVGRS